MIQWNLCFDIFNKLTIFIMFVALGAIRFLKALWESTISFWVYGVTLPGTFSVKIMNEMYIFYLST